MLRSIVSPNPGRNWSALPVCVNTLPWECGCVAVSYPFFNYDCYYYDYYDYEYYYYYYYSTSTATCN